MIIDPDDIDDIDDIDDDDDAAGGGGGDGDAEGSGDGGEGGDDGGKKPKNAITVVLVDVGHKDDLKKPVFQITVPPALPPGHVAVVRVPYRSAAAYLGAHCGIIVRAGPYLVLFRRILPVSVCGRPLSEDEKALGAHDFVADDAALAEMILPGTGPLFPPPSVGSAGAAGAGASGAASGAGSAGAAGAARATPAATAQEIAAAEILLKKALVALANSQRLGEREFALHGFDMAVLGPVLAQAQAEAMARL